MLLCYAKSIRHEIPQAFAMGTEVAVDDRTVMARCVQDQSRGAFQALYYCPGFLQIANA